MELLCHPSYQPHRCRLTNCNTQLPTLRRNLRKYLNNRFREIINRPPEYVVSTIPDCRYKLVRFPEREGDMLDTEESDENVDDNDGATCSSSRLASGTLHVLVVGASGTLQPIDRTHAQRLLLQMMGAVKTTGVGRARTSQARQESAVEDHSQPGSSRKSIFSKFAVPHVVCSETEYTLYYNSPTESEKLPEVYWACKSGRYPPLDKLA